MKEGSIVRCGGIKNQKYKNTKIHTPGKLYAPPKLLEYHDSTQAPAPQNLNF